MIKDPYPVPHSLLHPPRQFHFYSLAELEKKGRSISKLPLVRFTLLQSPAVIAVLDGHLHKFRCQGAPRLPADRTRIDLDYPSLQRKLPSWS